MSALEPGPDRASYFGFTASEARVLFGTSAVYALRMLGVYMAFPVLSDYAEKLPNATSMWVGMAVGAYGLTQALFQIPLGALGDRLGRGRTLALGLAVFGLGSLVCARAATAPQLVAGRLLQGAGAMASTMIALLGDRTREVVRTRAMAAMGVFIGGAFAVGLLIGPIMATRFGVPSLFAFSAASSAAGLVLLPWTLIGHARPVAGEAPFSPLRESVSALTRPPLVALDLGILALHLGLTALFVVLPFRLKEFLPPQDQWRVYAPVLFSGFLAMWISSHRAESRPGAVAVLTFGTTCLAVGFGIFAFARTLAALGIGLGIYVVGFASTEPSLAAQVTRQTEPRVRGTAAGIFNTVQFLGVFLGGLAAGACLHHSERELFLGIATLQIVWLFAARRILRARGN